MKLQWTAAGLNDLARLHEFLAPKNAKAAAQIVKNLVSAAERLLDHPRLGEKLDRYEPRDVRRVIVGNYELRYELNKDVIFVLRLWHAREDRP